VRRNGYFASGKFDQFKRDIPYNAFIQAMQDLTKQVLAEETEHVMRWRANLIQALGPNGRIIIDLIPEVQYIIGEQSPVPDLAPTESLNRFHSVIRAFLKTFAQREHPLVIFLDDLQWADSGTLRLIQYMQSDLEAGHLLLLAAYRDAEVGDAHPLRIQLQALRQSGSLTQELHLRALTLLDTYHILADALQLPAPSEKNIEAWINSVAQKASGKNVPARILQDHDPDSFAPEQKQQAEAAMAHLPGSDLAELIFRKTDGNPFFMNEFLKNLHQEKLVFLDPRTGNWNYDIHRIRAAGLSNDVLEFMVGAINRLR